MEIIKRYTDQYLGIRIYKNDRLIEDLSEINPCLYSITYRYAVISPGVKCQIKCGWERLVTIETYLGCQMDYPPCSIHIGLWCVSVPAFL